VLRSIIICPDPDASTRLEAALTSLGLVSVLRVLNAYPGAADLVRVLRALTPDLVFLSFESVAKAQETAQFLEKEVPGIQITAVHRICDAPALRETMRVGVREYVEYPFERQALVDSVKHSASLLQQKPVTYQGTTHIFSFLPSKAGVGASTLALNVSAALARRPEFRVLLSDFDLNSGMVRFLLKLKNEFSVLDAVERSNSMDENLWPQLVTSIHRMNVLHAGRVNPSIRIEGTQVRNLIHFMRTNYDALCFDLSGNLERYSLDIMHESRRILLVCTPEIPSLHLAREKLQFLKTVDLDKRVGVVLNRVPKKPVLGKAQVEEILGVPVIATLANDYHGVNRSTAAGAVVDPASELGKNYMEFAASLIETRSSQPDLGKKKFLQFFSAPGSQAELPR
jgi:pilus assembly protein CpaE